MLTEVTSFHCTTPLHALEFSHEQFFFPDTSNAVVFTQESRAGSTMETAVKAQVSLRDPEATWERPAGRIEQCGEDSVPNDILILIHSTRQPCTGQHSFMDQPSESILWQRWLDLWKSALIITIPEVTKGQKKKIATWLKHLNIGAQPFFSAMLYLSDLGN